MLSLTILALVIAAIPFISYFGLVLDTIDRLRTGNIHKGLGLFMLIFSTVAMVSFIVAVIHGYIHR